ncbi:MAG TPA: hypothetical protein VF278_25035 [Pirellulales bacterium]
MPIVEYIQKQWLDKALVATGLGKTRKRTAQFRGGIKQSEFDAGRSAVDGQIVASGQLGLIGKARPTCRFDKWTEGGREPAIQAQEWLL